MRPNRSHDGHMPFFADANLCALVFHEQALRGRACSLSLFAHVIGNAIR